MSADAVIRTEGLTRDFGDLRAVDHLDLVLPRQGIFGFLGPNGAGKTTTLRLLLGLIEPSEGRAEILGMDPARQGEAVRARCGALLEHHGLYERLDAEENLDFYARINRMSASDSQRRSRHLLEHFGLWDRRGERVGRWSKGMKQKLAIIRALLHDPDILLLDEPTSGLDAMSAAALRQELVRLARESDVTIFLTTHNLAEAEQVCDQVGIFRAGRLLMTGAPGELRRRASRPALDLIAADVDPGVVAELRSRPGVSSADRTSGGLRVELGEGASAADLVAFLVARGVAVEEVRRTSATLEEVFVSLVEGEEAP